MNRDNIKRVRDHIAGLPQGLFDMGWWGRNGDPGCGTACCIGGWAERLLLAPQHPERKDFSVAETSAALGLPSDVADRLFFPSFTTGAYTATPTGAVRVLDHLLGTGQVDWTKARGAR